MFKRFTERARRVIILAREEAEKYHHEYLGTEHILLGMLKDGGGIAITVLQKSGLTIEQIRAEVERHLPRNANALIVGEIPFTHAYPELWVDDARDAARARSVIEEFERTPSGEATRRCAQCGEDNPSRFELCWQCGTAIGTE